MLSHGMQLFICYIFILKSIFFVIAFLILNNLIHVFWISLIKYHKGLI